MDKKLEQEIIKLRKSGYGYKKIASILNISNNSISSFCRRNNINTSSLACDGYCAYCGMPFSVDKNHKNKRFCSDRCRYKWWNENKEKVNEKKKQKAKCKYCSKEFMKFPTSPQKYCSFGCYIKDRFRR